MNHIEAMKQALKALEDGDYWEKQESITPLRQAIKEHALREVQRLGQEIEQEPVAWMDATGFIYKIKPESVWLEVQPLKPLYIHPQPKREWIGLTAEQVVACWHVNGEQFWRNIEAKLKEKNNA